MQHSENSDDEAPLQLHGPQVPTLEFFHDIILTLGHKLWMLYSKSQVFFSLLPQTVLYHFIIAWIAGTFVIGYPKEGAQCPV